jgi:hypothetical protein
MKLAIRRGIAEPKMILSKKKKKSIKSNKKSGLLHKNRPCVMVVLDE